MKQKKIIENYYVFLADNSSLFSFNRDGAFSSIFFPDKDYYQNLSSFNSWIYIDGKTFELNSKNFLIDICFSEDYRIVNIFYYPKHHLLRLFGYKDIFIKKIKDKNKDNFKNNLKNKGYFIKKEILLEEFNNNDEKNSKIKSYLLVKTFFNNLKVSSCIEYYVFKLKDSENYHSASLLLQQNNLINSRMISVYKQDIRINLLSKDIFIFYPLHQGFKNKKFNNIFSNLINLIKNKEKIDFYQNSYETLANKIFIVYNINQNGGNFLESKLELEFLVKSIATTENQNLNEYDDFQDYIDKEFMEKDILEKTSIYVLNKLQTKTGAILASFEQDEKYEYSGGYGYCWGRDAAIISDIMGKNGFKNYSKKFLEFILNAFSEDNYVHQRYYSNGLKAPCWGDQYDETGLILWSLNNYLKYFNDINFILINTDKIIKLIKFLVNLYDKDINLFKPCMDLWEERFGYHLFSQVSCIEGLKASFDLIGRIELEKNVDIKKEFYKEFSFFKSDFDDFYKIFYKNLINSFMYIDEKKVIIIRSFLLKNKLKNSKNKRNDKINKDEINFNEKYKQIISNSNLYENLILKGYCPDYTLDISSLCLIYPFNINFLSIDEKKRLIYFIDKALLNRKNFFHYRYVGDRYFGGNSWIITTLWLYISKIELFKNIKSDFGYDFENLNKDIEYIIKKLKIIANSVGFLPEQIDNKMNPLWIQPLGWTHALVLELFNKKKNLGGIL
ncbi:MAG: hypothetical protein N3A58_08295 [Spirochaetes bacterium]|nr:hypothetical protein [Spirochaetota bacterium]